MQPAELDLLEEMLRAQQAERVRLNQHYADHVKRTAYEAHLARRQYQAVDPDNRLVAAELERHWELALRAAADAQEAAERFAQTEAASALAPTLRDQLRDLGRHLPTVWASGRLTPAHKKELLRSLIRRVILSRPTPEAIAVKVVWVSGAYSVLTVPTPVHRGADLPNYAPFVARILELSAQGYQDAAIAGRLTGEGFRTARRSAVSAKAVEMIRRTQGQGTLTEQFRCADKIDGAWTVHGLAGYLAVSSAWVRKRIADGSVVAALHPLTQRYLIADNPAMLEHLKARVAGRYHR